MDQATPLDLFNSEDFQTMEKQLFAAFAVALDRVLPLVIREACDPEVLLALFRWTVTEDQPAVFWSRVWAQNAAVTTATVRQHIEDTRRMAQAIGGDQRIVSSFQCRNEAAGVLGGGVRVGGNFVFATAGKLEEDAREAVSLLTAFHTGLLSCEEGRTIAALSNNEVIRRYIANNSSTTKGG